jgi:hypothetical protein
MKRRFAAIERDGIHASAHALQYVALAALST